MSDMPPVPEGAVRARIHLIGPDRYCPYCKRLLVSVHEDGSHDLAGHASIAMEARGDPAELEQLPEEERVIEGFVTEAHCFRRLCRWRRRWAER